MVWVVRLWEVVAGEEFLGEGYFRVLGGGLCDEVVCECEDLCVGL